MAIFGVTLTDRSWIFIIGVENEVSLSVLTHPQQTFTQKLVQWCARIADDGPTLNQHQRILLGYCRIQEQEVIYISTDNHYALTPGCLVYKPLRLGVVSSTVENTAAHNLVFSVSCVCILNTPTWSHGGYMAYTHVPNHSTLCKAKRLYLLTCKVSRCCLLSLQGSCSGPVMYAQHADNLLSFARLLGIQASQQTRHVDPLD